MLQINAAAAMSISPTSDLILDVARAADPLKAQATTRALAAASAGVDATAAFSTALDRVAAAPASAGRDFSYQNPVAAVRGPVETSAHKAEVGLESVFLKQFVEEMLPKDATAVFGSGVAGDVWKSMMAEKIADQIAESGSLKIGKRLFATHPQLLRSNRHDGLTNHPPAPLASNKV